MTTSSAAAYALIYGDTGEQYFTQVWPGDPPNEYGTPPDPASPPADLGYITPPNAADLARFLGWPPPDEEQQETAQQHLDRALLLVRAYVRNRGFTETKMAPALREVILSAAGRSLNNPTSDARVTAGQYASSPGQPDYTLQERLILDGYRRRAA